MTVAEVRLWGRTIAAVAVDGPGEVAAFEYDPEFQSSAIEVAPLVMPLGPRIHRFPELPRPTFHGLPGMLADALPDRFGNAVIDTWLASQGRLPGEIDTVERLCYTGSRGMGALEFRPARGPRTSKAVPVDVDSLTQLAAEVLSQRASLSTSLRDPAREEALREILRVGASAGGARAKAVIAYHPETHEVRSGQVPAPPGFEDWIIKFDGVSADQDGLAEPQGYGALEHAYAEMARDAGIDVMPTRLFEEGGRRHFMTRRFDRRDGQKIHMQSLGALAHLDFNAPGAHGYEQALLVVRRLGLGAAGLEAMFRRMIFNLVTRNQDDHVKNISFLMDKAGQWSLAPAFDLNFAYNPAGLWTRAHQMTVNGKRDGFVADDLLAVARAATLDPARCRGIAAEVVEAAGRFPDHARAAGVPAPRASAIHAQFRVDLLGAWPR